MLPFTIEVKCLITATINQWETCWNPELRYAELCVVVVPAQPYRGTCQYRFSSKILCNLISMEKRNNFFVTRIKLFVTKNHDFVTRNHFLGKQIFVTINNFLTQ